MRKHIRVKRYFESSFNRLHQNRLFMEANYEDGYRKGQDKLTISAGHMIPRENMRSMSSKRGYF